MYGYYTTHSLTHYIYIYTNHTIYTIRSLDIKERKKYIELVEEVKDNGGAVQIFVTGTEKEKELAKLTGVAAILNFTIQ